MPESLAYELHQLTARLDRAADELLRGEAGVSYARFLALFAVRETRGTQRELARWLGQSEPSTSRMVGVLTEVGLLSVSRPPGAGNQRRLELTEKGTRLVQRCGRLLDGRFTDLVRRSGIPLEAYQLHTRTLLAQLEDDRGRSSGRPGAGRG